MNFFTMNITLALTICEFAENRHKKHIVNRVDIRDKNEKSEMKKNIHSIIVSCNTDESGFNVSTSGK